jgi:transposase
VKKGTLQMSRKERETLVVMERVKAKEMKLVEAAEVLGISYRQCRRRHRRYEEEGAAGLLHGLRGRSSNRGLSEEVRAAIAGLYRDKYDDFGPVLFTEKLLSAHEIRVDHETVRRVLIKEGLWRVTRKRKKAHRGWRERRAHFGEMIQMDGSHHHWFEERGESGCLMVMIDDATGERMSLMAREETTDAAMRLLWMWIERYGVPQSLYTDKKNVFVPCEKDEEKARLEGREALTQFGRACSRLGIRIIRAHSPQAKGRVERSNAVYQDRFVKELRLEGISSIEEANDLLAGGFDRDLNNGFAIEPREKADYHRAASPYDLQTVFCIEQERTLSVNWTISFENRVYRIGNGLNNYSPASRKVQVRRYLDGKLHMFYRGNEVTFEEFDPKKKKTQEKKPYQGTTRQPPGGDHPWRNTWSEKQLSLPRRIS